VARVREEARGKSRRRPSAYLRRFHYDTVVHHELALRYLVDLVGSDRVVVGSDYRFDMGCLDPVRTVREVRRLPRADRATILGGAAAARLLRL
jgi:aminocarboxymuconate-semialdehyde decarboxylase